MQLPKDWNSTIQNRGGYVLHGTEWANFQTSIGRQVYFDISENWYYIMFNRQVSGLRYMLAMQNPLIGSDARSALESLCIKARDEKCDFVRIEPNGAISTQDLEAMGAQRIHDVEPRYSLVVDLTLSEEELRHNLQSGHRNRINTGEKRGINIMKTTDTKVLPAFLRLMHDTADHAKITNHPDWYYQKMATSLIEQGMASFYVATVENTPASISLIYDWGDTRYYAHTGNDQVLNRQYKAAVSNVWQMIIDAKSDGKKHFDLWGMAPPDEPNHPWAGITEFKKGFGAEAVQYHIGTYDIPLNKPKYKLYSTYQKMRGRR